MKPLLSSLVIALLACQAAGAQIRVPFLEERPVIDGMPDPVVLARTESVPLAVVKKSSEANPDFDVRLRMAYGTDFLYLLVEADGDSIVHRDRSYQNGDGFHCTIARPRADNAPTDEFYVLRFSPATDSLQTNARLGVWYYNIDLQGRKLSPQAQLKTSRVAGKTYFEAALPWTDVHPYHPLAASLGFNVCFVKAIGGKEKNEYFLAADEHMQQEGQLRRYCIPAFMPPEKVSHARSFIALARTTIVTGQTDTAIVYHLAPRKGSVTIHLGISKAEEKSAAHCDVRRTVRVKEGMNVIRIPLAVRVLPVGSSVVSAEVGTDSANTARLSVLPTTGFEVMRRVFTAERGLREGTRTTLLFMTDRLEARVRALRSYEDGTSLGRELDALLKLLNETRAGEDPFEYRTGTFRRAFLSALDTTLRPYSVKIPASYSPKRRYPLFVFLHGSGESDEGALNNTPLTDGEWIELAPNGRGVSNCFTTDHAQEDIEEAINDVMKNYPIDTSRIVIAGFSMGGYGAYRTFYEHPLRYCGIAVFSGHPSLASRWIGPGHPDFLETSFLHPFKNVPMFVYHSENDRNCPYELTCALIEKLKAAGADLKIAIARDGGHSLIDTESMPRYLDWLRERAKGQLPSK